MNYAYVHEIGEPFALGYLQGQEAGPYTAMGEGLYAEGQVMSLEYDPDTGLFQCNRYPSAIGFVSASGLFYHKDRIREKREKFPAYADFFAAAEEALSGMDTGSLIWNSFTDRERKCMDNMTLWGGTWAGHTVPHFGAMLELGTNGYRRKIAKYREIHPYANDFYTGLERVLDMFDLLGEKVRSHSLRMAEETDDRTEKNHFLALAKAMETCPRNPPYDFLSACQCFWLFFSYDGYDSPGRMDQFLFPWWKKTPRDEAMAVLDGMWQGFHKHRTWNICISGSDEHWKDTTNDLSFAFLELVKKYRYQTPNLTMRCFEGTDPALLHSAAEALAAGCGLPALYNDRAVCRMFADELDIPPQDAHNYAMNGCNQIDIQGKSHMGLEDGEVNLYKCLEYTLTRGKCLITGEILGEDTGDPASFATFDELLAAFRKQVEAMTDMACRMSNKAQRIHGSYAPNLFRSLLIEGCIENGRDFKSGGPLYNHGQILAEGLADTIDSLAAIRYHVFREKTYTLPQIIAAMERDFQGDEIMRQKLSEKPARFGNGDPDTDALAGLITEHFFRYLLTLTTWRGGRYSGGCSPFNRAANNGCHVGAGANGRHKGDPLIADSIGATPGRDVEGPTALLDSVLHLPHHLAGSGFILNIKFDKAVFRTNEGMKNFLALLDAFFTQGGQQLSVTVVSREDLLDARLHPENHRNLIVRVGGYSDYFINISPDLQDNVIARTGYGR